MDFSQEKKKNGKSDGSIAIEFAFVLPTLVALMYLLLNHYKFYELKSKIKSSAFLAASMIQNLTNTRDDKKLTKDDFKRIAFASSLNIFLNNSVFTGARGSNYKLTVRYGKKISGGNEGITIICNTAGASKVSGVSYSGTASTSNDSDITLSADGDEGMSITAELVPASGTSYDTSKMGFFDWNSTTCSFIVNIKSNFRYQVEVTPKPGIIDTTTLNGSSS